MTRHECSEESCTAPTVARGICHKHYEQGRRANLLPPLLHVPSLRDKHEMWTDRSHGLTACHKWTGPCDKNGYGHLVHRGQAWLAHRLGFFLNLRLLGPKEFLLHQCDNPPCQNLLHLFVGTQAQNIQDAVDRDRVAHGERNGKAKLTEPMVRLIRASSLSGARLAPSLGVTYHAVLDVRKGRTWRRTK